MFDGSLADYSILGLFIGKRREADLKPARISPHFRGNCHHHGGRVEGIVQGEQAEMHHEGIFSGSCNGGAAGHISILTYHTLYFSGPPRPTGWGCKWYDHFQGPAAAPCAHQLQINCEQGCVWGSQHLRPLRAC